MFVRQVPALDSPSYDIAQHFDEMTNLIELVMAARDRLQQPSAAAGAATSTHLADGPVAARHSEPAVITTTVAPLLPAVVVHCLAGISRSSTIVAAYLMKRSRTSADGAVAFLTEARPVVQPNTGFLAQLSVWESCNHQTLASADAALRVGQSMARQSVADLASSLRNLIRLLVSSQRMALDRLNFPVSIAALINEGAVTSEDVRDHLRHVVSAALINDEFIDSPKMFSNIAELVEAMRQTCPEPLLVPATVVPPEGSPLRQRSHSEELQDFTFVSHQHRATPVLAQASTKVVFSDDIHFEFLQCLVDRPQCDAWSTCEAVVNYLHHIHRVSSTGCAAPHCLLLLAGSVPRVAVFQLPSVMQVSFPVLGLIAKFAEGFCDFQEWARVEKDPVSSLSLLRRRFLVCRDDGTLASVGTASMKRWDSPFVAFLQRDVEGIMLDWALGATATAGDTVVPDDAWLVLQQLLHQAATQCILPEDPKVRAGPQDVPAQEMQMHLLARFKAKCFSAAEVVFQLLHPVDGETFLAKLRHAVRVAVDRGEGKVK
jgi:hypothetical protein